MGGAQAELSVAEDVRALLATWKQDPAALRRRFDLDVNAEIDLQQWEAVRRAATRQVEQAHREVRNVADSHIVRAPRDGRVFLISPLSPRKLRRRYLWWSAFHLVMAALGVGLLLRH